MFKPDQVFIVRNRFRPPVIEHAWVADATEEGIELLFSPVIPYRPGEEIQVLAESETGRLACRARARCATAAGRWFEIDTWVVIERRRNPRIAVDIPAVMRCDHHVDITGRVTNLSSEGFLFESSVRAAGTMVDLSLASRGGSHTFPCKLILVRPGSQDRVYLAHLQLETEFATVRQHLENVFKHELAAAIRAGEVSAG